MTRLLLERGADVRPISRKGNTALLCAALANRQEIIPLLVEAGARVGPVEAAVLGDQATLMQLLEWGADVNAANEGGMTPLMGAAAGGHLEILTLLLARGAEIDRTDEEGKTALAWTVFYNRIDATRLLLDSGADVNLAGHDRSFAKRLQERASRQNLEPSEFLERAMQRRGCAPLGLAAFRDETEMAALLLERGADINAGSGVAGRTPLACAAMAGKAIMVRFLLDHGADPTIADERRYTALMLAEQFGKNPEVVSMLKEAAGTP